MIKYKISIMINKAEFYDANDLTLFIPDWLFLNIDYYKYN